MQKREGAAKRASAVQKASIASRGLCLALVAVATGCDLTRVESPDVVSSDEYKTPAAATILAGGAITEFHNAFGAADGGTGHFVVATGIMSDELLTTTRASSVETVFRRDRRDEVVGGFLGFSPYTQIQSARQQALTAISTFQQVAEDSTPRIGHLFAYLGYTSVMLGEMYCAGVPLSHRDAAFRPVYGKPLTTSQVFDSALVAFDSAMVYGIDSARIVNLARVGRGRALLNLGRFADAEQAVANVPTAYVYNATYVSTTLDNGFFGSSGNPLWNTWVTIPDVEGGNGINWRSAGDPRVTTISRPATGVRPAVVGFVPYQASNAPIRLASGIEARLIEAEAALQAGNAAIWLARLNALRALGTAGGGVNGLSPLSDPGNAAARIDMMFRERAFWLFLTGHRLGDLRRLVRQYGRSQATVFPVGPWYDSAYGPATNDALPVLESNNPHYRGCLNRDA